MNATNSRGSVIQGFFPCGVPRSSAVQPQIKQPANSTQAVLQLQTARTSAQQQAIQAHQRTFAAHQAASHGTRGQSGQGVQLAQPKAEPGSSGLRAAQRHQQILDAHRSVTAPGPPLAAGTVQQFVAGQTSPCPPVAQPTASGTAFRLPEHLADFGPNIGQRLPDSVRQKMESFFGTSFADVRVHVGAQASSIGALAFTHGSNLYFAPGQYNPNTVQGQQLLGHELTHVVQQRSARVRNPFGSGIAVMHDRAMEAEAGRMGLLAAHAPSQRKASTVAAQAIQPMWSQSPVYLGHDGQGHVWQAPNGYVFYGAAPTYGYSGGNVPSTSSGSGFPSTSAPQSSTTGGGTRRSRAIAIVDPNAQHQDRTVGSRPSLRFNAGWTKYQKVVGNYSAADIEAILNQLATDKSTDSRKAKFLYAASQNRIHSVNGNPIGASRLEVVEGIHEAASEGKHITVQAVYDGTTTSKIHVNVAASNSGIGWTYSHLSHNLASIPDTFETNYEQSRRVKIAALREQEAREAAARAASPSSQSWYQSQQEQMVNMGLIKPGESIRPQHDYSSQYIS